MIEPWTPFRGKEYDCERDWHHRDLCAGLSALSAQLAELAGMLKEYLEMERNPMWFIDQNGTRIQRVTKESQLRHRCCVCDRFDTIHMPETGYSGEGWYCAEHKPGPRPF